MASSSQDLCEAWLSISDGDLTLEHVRATLEPIEDDLWVVAACLDRILNDADVQRGLTELGLQRTVAVVTRGKTFYTPPEDEHTLHYHASPDEALVSYFRDEPVDARLLNMRSVLLERLDRLNTYVEMCKSSSFTTEDKSTDADEEWEDDPWGDEVEEEVEASTPGSLPLALSAFLTDDLLQSACFLATTLHFRALCILLKRHSTVLWPVRFSILDNIPEHAHPSQLQEIFPAFDTIKNEEQRPFVNDLNPERDWCNLETVQLSLEASKVLIPDAFPSPSDVGSKSEPLSSQEICLWYTNRVDKVLVSTGMIDVALATVQHGASQGIPGLDELGEELLLLSRLVYDAPPPNASHAEDDWTLERWRALDPPAVIRAYLSYSSSETVVSSIRKLVMPYLFVLEARAERSGHPDPSLPTRLLHEYILSAPLDIVASIFEASKPTLPLPQRVISDDTEMARLALACLYGSDRVDDWPTMSRIFECLPAWDIDANDGEQGDETDTTVASLGAFVTPTTARPTCTPSDLIIFFRPLPSSSLSRALDILDVHLECGEILSRWGAPAPLRWFLQSANNEAEQRAWATRMAWRAGGSEDEVDSQDDAEWLLEDMLKLSGTNSAGLKSAFGFLSQEEVARIFFSGLLSTGKFEIAKTLLKSKKSLLSLDAEAVEEICLACSREFYDNASSGNYRFGDMKLAYDCLSVPAPSERIRREQDFIEATSRINSFNVMSRPGIPISPIEIRLCKDRLTLVSRVLSSNADAYKYTDVILDLTRKLGYQDDVAAEVKSLAMIADTAFQHEDFARAYEANETMINTVLKLKSAGTDGQQFQDAAEVCWLASFQLGRQPEFDDTQKKLRLLGRTLAFCPADKLVDVLAVWQRLESEDIKMRKERLEKRRADARPEQQQRKRATAPSGAFPSLAAQFSRLQMPDLHLASSSLAGATDAAALASKFSRVAASFPFSVGGHAWSADQDDHRRSESREGIWGRSEHVDVSAQASRVLQKGIGWLIGTDDD